MITVCPSEEELLAVATGDEPSAELESHLLECGRCIRKISGLRLEVRGLQKAFIPAEPGHVLPTETPVITQVPSDSPAATPPSSTPEKIGKYLVIGALGSGGQASVYRAVHPTLDEQVVLKLSSRTTADGDFAKNDRLIGEGRILVQLKHANIGRIYDLDFFERRPFLVMEYVRGRAWISTSAIAFVSPRRRSPL